MAEKDEQTRLLQELHEKVTQMSADMQKTQIAEYVQLLNSPRRLIWPNLIGGISRGVGIAVGLTIFTSGIVYILKALGALDLPIVGGFIADIVQHVQTQLDSRQY